MTAHFALEIPALDQKHEGLFQSFVRTEKATTRVSTHLDHITDDFNMFKTSWPGGPPTVNRVTEFEFSREDGRSAIPQQHSEAPKAPQALLKAQKWPSRYSRQVQEGISL